MHWYSLVALFLGGAFLANAVPHIVNGISGRAFQTPFAKPPGKGVSPSIINVLWGFLNLFVAWLLLILLGHFDIHNWVHVAMAFVGALILAMTCARHFGRFHGGR
jgi:cobalamin synthase